ncbi:hypothetical protein ACHAWF_002172 [Thalassiosira exigua]
MAAAEAIISTVARALDLKPGPSTTTTLCASSTSSSGTSTSVTMTWPPAPRLSLPAKQLRRTLRFLEEEQLVKHELVDDLAMGGSQNTKFWYIDYNHAVHVIRLRVYLLQKKLQAAELRARSSSLYLCPGYKSKLCNGKYSETDAQRVVDPETRLFLCRECVRAYANHPTPPDRSEYNQRELKGAVDDLRRVRAQLSSKSDARN